MPRSPGDCLEELPKRQRTFESVFKASSPEFLRVTVSVNHRDFIMSLVFDVCIQTTFYEIFEETDQELLVFLGSFR